MHNTNLGTSNEGLEQKLIKLIMSAKIWASTNSQQNAVGDGGQTDEPQQIERISGSCIDVKGQPALQRLKDVIFRMDDEVMYP